uniref:Uncharacterized protein n=1 Tax=Anguilla anguilla TaxID=7936 RepID=A0A0E9WMB5_ANGAN
MTGTHDAPLPQPTLNHDDSRPVRKPRKPVLRFYGNQNCSPFSACLCEALDAASRGVNTRLYKSAQVRSFFFR